MCEFCDNSIRTSGPDTNSQFREILEKCRALFEKKLNDYGPSWRIFRPSSVTDQIFIKANRIRSIEIKGKSLIDDDILSEYIGIVNYGIIALIQLEKGFSESVDMTPKEALREYDANSSEALELMLNKNHDYDEAWRGMRISSYIDIILVKLNRIKEIEKNNGQTTVSEGVGANYLDIVNYAVFALIKLVYEQ
ncbi:MAG TPA: DUF1599 domain-containing protein [Bacteroidaceae bacterium]|nr:DUF1599 domain-containing protein [Bacteroidaceae bacterium]